MKLTQEQQCMLSILLCWYHACWCSDAPKPEYSVSSSRRVNWWATLVTQNWDGPPNHQSRMVHWATQDFFRSTASTPYTHISESTLVQITAYRPTAPSHYLNQCRLNISEVQWQKFQQDLKNTFLSYSVDKLGHTDRPSDTGTDNTPSALGWGVKTWIHFETHVTSCQAAFDWAVCKIGIKPHFLKHMHIPE